MRGRDAVRKSTLKVNILQVSTIDFSEIQFIVNHDSQSDGQNKSWTNLQKKTIHIVSFQRKRGDTKDNGNLTMNKMRQKWANETSIRFSSCCLYEKSSTPRVRRTKLKSLFLRNNTGCGIPLQAHRGGTSLNGIGKELIRIFSKWCSFCYSWFRLLSMATHCNRRRV